MYMVRRTNQNSTFRDRFNDVREHHSVDALCVDDTRNNLGSVRQLAAYDAGKNATTIENYLEYDSFGNITHEENTALDHLFAYTGRERDEETGLHFYRARYFDPVVGRFISEDPIGFEAEDANLYRYVFNESLNSTDPLGTEPKPDVIADQKIKVDAIKDKLAKGKQITDLERKFISDWEYQIRWLQERGYDEKGYPIQPDPAGVEAQAAFELQSIFTQKKNAEILTGEDVAQVAINVGVELSETDWAGKELLERWLYGDGTPYKIKNDQRWTTYMEASYDVAAMVKNKLFGHAKSLTVEHDAPASGQIHLKFRGSIAASTYHPIGYGYLHGTDEAFEIIGQWSIDGQKGQNRAIKYNLTYVWNDKIDMNSGEGDTKFKLLTDRASGVRGGKDYDIRIEWTEPVTEIVISPSGTFVSATGYPYGQLPPTSPTTGFAKYLKR
ncbi:MAG: RHS repeat-associated core domain-containing protein [Planctomycetes bacterium]|nr:RHS repeat-associated core domain-containing protein [Planctomycetota bacterium]